MRVLTKPVLLRDYHGPTRNTQGPEGTVPFGDALGQTFSRLRLKRARVAGGPASPGRLFDKQLAHLVTITPIVQLHSELRKFLRQVREHAYQATEHAANHYDYEGHSL